jgi:hypothetical protein
VVDEMAALDSARSRTNKSWQYTAAVSPDDAPAEQLEQQDSNSSGRALQLLKRGPKQHRESIYLATKLVTCVC